MKKTLGKIIKWISERTLPLSMISIPLIILGFSLSGDYEYINSISAITLIVGVFYLIAGKFEK